MDLPQAELKRIKIRMETPFADFCERRRNQFLTDLATITGCPENEIVNVTFRAGCVIFEGDLDSNAIDRLLALYKERGSGSESLELHALLSFLEEYAVSKMTDDLEICVQIRKTRKIGNAKPMAILVHGWNGDSGSFGKMPEYLRELTKFDVEVYPLLSSWWKHSPSIYFIARNLDNWIRLKAEGRELSLIAHSMGGMVVRRLMTMQRELPTSFERLVRNLTFIAAPQNGAALASIARHIPLLQSVQLDELAPSSPVLFEVNAQWDKWVRRNVPTLCTMRSIFGTADQVVSVNDARGLDPEAVPILGADHIGIVKPSRVDDEVVQTIAMFLRDSGFSKTPHESLHQ